MSRIIKHLIICLVIANIVNGCHKPTIKPTKQKESILEQEFIDTRKDILNVKTINTNPNDGDNQNNAPIVNQMQYEPTDVVNNLLQNPSNNLHIAVIAPMTGKQASIGKMITESIILTLSKSKYNNSGIVNVYNIDKLPDKDFENNAELQRLLHDNNDIIIGSIYEDTTKKILSLLPEDKLFISYINDDTMTKQYPNLVVLGMNEGYKIASLCQYLKDNKRQFLALILPATKKGYDIEKLFRKIATNNEIIISSSHFYQTDNNNSISSAVKGVNKNFTASYMIDENGKFITETYKQNKLKKQLLKQELKDNALVDNSLNVLEVQQIDTNAIYIEANENNLMTILNHLDKQGILNKNVQLFSDAVIKLENSDTTKLDNVYYIGYNYDVIDLFNKNFNSYFGHSPNHFAYLVYDTLSMLNFVSNEGKMLPSVLYNNNGFRGILDEFKFTREGNVERRFNIYKLVNQSMSRIFAPDDYINLSTATGQSSVYFE